MTNKNLLTEETCSAVLDKLSDNLDLLLDACEVAADGADTEEDAARFMRMRARLARVIRQDGKTLEHIVAMCGCVLPWRIEPRRMKAAEELAQAPAGVCTICNKEMTGDECGDVFPEELVCCACAGLTETGELL